MNRTQEIIQKIKNALITGRMRVEEVPISDLKYCVKREISLYESTYTPTQFGEVNKSFETFCSHIGDGETDSEKVLMFLDGMLICVQTISESVRSLASREFWSILHQNDKEDPEVAEIIDFVDRRHDVQLLNYDFVDDYLAMSCEVLEDEHSGLRYVPYRNRKMFFPRGWEAERIANYFRTVVAEQDARSPHNYRKDGYEIKSGDVIVDAGAAEGFFSLDHIDEAGHIYVIDADEGWIGALKQTFRNDMDKVDIVYGYVGEEDDGDLHFSLDRLLGDQRVDYIKMDIEGYEKGAMSGARKVLENNAVTCAVCAYHYQEDEAWITDYLMQLGYQTDHSRGYMCPDWCLDGRLKAELRRGVVFGRKV